MTSGWALAIAKCRTIKLADGAEAVEADQDTIVDDVVVFRDGLRCFPHDGTENCRSLGGSERRAVHAHPVMESSSRSRQVVAWEGF